MSRTIRRSKGEKPWYIGRDWSSNSRDWIPLEGKALAKALSKYHGDHGFGRTSLRCKHGSDEPGLRMLAKEEIARWEKNPEHQIQVPTKRHLRDYWD